MSNRFEDEQLEIKQQIKNLEKTVKEEATHELNSNKFLETARKFTQIEELNLQILQAFVDHITVGRYQMVDGFKEHEIEICYKFVGNVNLPHMSRRVKHQMLRVFRREENQKRVAVG
ncbi:MAG: DUF4368 domain-containing protein [Oscillospiraceae bacterium]|jgi:hypothetical protein|nr:DUF4368 domain-containing protein [Oscillospiraceae bacterium]